MYNTRFQQQLDRFVEDLTNFRKCNGLWRTLEIIPCVEAENGEWVADPKYLTEKRT